MRPMTTFRSPSPRARVMLGLFFLSAFPSVVASQGEARLGIARPGEAPLVVAAVGPVAGIGRCLASQDAPEPSWRRILEARTLSRDEARPLLAHLVDSLSLEAAARPDAVRAQYLLAVALGAQAEVEGGRTRIRAARALHEQLAVVFELDPGHPGAQHLLGRLHAAVRRMDSVTRWVATRLLGGGALAQASWTEARAWLESAVVGDPCVPDHHYELARLYADLGQDEAARERLGRLLELPDTDPLYASVFERARALRGALGEQRR
jgi:hypothetical protein